METAPSSPATQTQDLKARVQQVLNTIRPALQMDGGDCDLVDVTADGIVHLKLRGACGSCPSSTMTLKMGIEKRLKSSIPEIKSLIAV
jgi:Fe-S cluster biogenesis protein NfuA